MKTTVELPDSLLIEAKKKAAELRRPLRSLIEEGLRNELQLLNTPKSKKKKTVNWDKVTVQGGIPEGLDLTNRDQMVDWLDKHP